MGAVYAAHDRLLGEHVAIKILHPAERSGDAAMGKLAMAEQVMQPDDAGQQGRAANQRIRTCTTRDGVIAAAAIQDIVGRIAKQRIRTDRAGDVLDAVVGVAHR